MKRIALFAVIAAFVFTSAVFAEGDKIALIDMGRVMKESNTGKEQSAKLRKAEAQKRNQLKAKEEAIMNIRKELETKAQVLSDAKKLELKQKEEKLLLEYKGLRESAQKEMVALQRTVHNEYNSILMPILQDYCKKNGYQVVLPTNIVLYYDEAKKINITDDFIKLVNQKVPPKK